MNKSFFKKNPMLKLISNSLIYLPTPVNISIMWNFGSMLGLNLMIQILSGLFLSMHYCPNINEAFESIIHIIQDVNYGWMIRNIHMNGASFFFICMYLHIFRGLYYHSYKLTFTWMIGVIILLISMGTAFLGYVLPWGQMSFWGATVITNLMSAIPYFGNEIVQWLWGGFSIDNPTLNRFYSLHFILPFVILFMVLIHLMFLHQTGSNNPTGLESNFMKIMFHFNFTIKDIIGFLIIIYIMLITIFIVPYKLSDPDNFIPANPYMTPKHIQPEWYFLFAYAILRAIPNKLSGVIALLMSIIILMTLPLSCNMHLMKSSMFYPLNQQFFWLFLSSSIILTWTGMKPIMYPFTQISQIMSMVYFSFFLFMPMMNMFWDKMIKN